MMSVELKMGIKPFVIVTVLVAVACVSTIVHDHVETGNIEYYYSHISYFYIFIPGFMFVVLGGNHVRTDSSMAMIRFVSWFNILRKHLVWILMESIGFVILLFIGYIVNLILIGSHILPNSIYIILLNLLLQLGTFFLIGSIIIIMKLLTKSQVMSFCMIYSLILIDYLSSYGVGVLPLNIDLFFKPLRIAIFYAISEFSNGSIVFELINIFLKICIVLFVGYLVLVKRNRRVHNDKA